MAGHAPRALLVRAVGWLLIGVGTGIVVLLALAHTPWVQRRVGGWALGSLRQFDVDAHAERVRYNLLTLHVRAEGVSLARSSAPGQPPFAQLRAVDITVPWSALRGRLSIASIQLDSARVTLVRRADGSTNWPSNVSRADGSAVSPFPVGRLTAHDLAFAWRDEILDSTVDIESANLDLAPGPRGAAGTLRLDRPARVVQHGHETAIAARAQLAWNGTRLTIDSLRLESPEAEMRASGAIDLLIAHPQIALDYEGGLQLGGLAPWLGIVPRPAGPLDVRGRVMGALADLRAEATVTSSGLTWRGLAASSVDVAMKLDARSLDIDRASVAAVGGALQARGRVALGAGDSASRLTLDWQGVDGDLLLHALGASPPAPVATRVDGRATASWAAWRADALTMSAEATTRPDRPGGRRIGLAGSASVRTSEGGWNATIEQSIDEALQLRGTVGGRLSDTFGRTTVAGHMAATADAGDRLWLLLQKIDVAPVKSPPVVAGRARVDLAVAGTIAAPTADLLLTVADWRQGPVGPVALDGRLALTTRRMVVDDLAARIGKNSLQARGSVSFADGRIDGRMDATLVALDELLPDASRDMRPSGTMEASATISGTLSSPVIDGRASGLNLSVAGQHANRLDASVALARNVFRMERLELTQPDGHLTANGSYDLKTRAVAGIVDARNIAIVPIAGAEGAVRAPVGARFDANVSASGTVDDPRGEGRIELRDALWGDRRLGRISGTLTLADHRLQSMLQMPDLFASATASLAIEPFGAFVVDAQVTDGDLAALTSRLAAPTQAPVTGKTTFAAHVDGRIDRLARSHATLDLRRLDASVGDVPVRAARAGRVVYDERSIDVGDVVLEIGRSQLRVAGRLDREGAGQLTASLDGTLRDLGQVAIGFSRAGQIALPELDGRVTIAASVTGPIGRPSIDATLRLDEGRVAVAGLPPATGITMRASYGAGVLDLSELRGAWQGASVTASGRAPLTLLGDRLPTFLRRAAPDTSGVGRLDARLESMTPTMLAPWLPADALGQLQGVMSGTLTLEADAPSIAGVRGRLVLDQVELALAGVEFDQRRPTRLELAGGRLQIVDWEWGAAENPVSLAGSVRLDGRPALDLSAHGVLDLRALGAFLPQVSTAGRAALEAHVTGWLDAPRIDGRIDVRDGDIRAPAAGLVVSDVAGRVVLAGDELTVPVVYGNANGGTLTIAGRVRYAGGPRLSGRLAITGRGMAMAMPQALKTEIDADLSLGVEPDALSLSGDVTVLRGAYREPVSLAGGLVQALQQAPVSIETEPASFVDRMALDVRVATADDIIVDNNYAQLAVGGDLRVGGTVAQPVLLGRVDAREGGRIFLGGHVYRLDRDGTVDFSNPARIEPDVNISAVTHVAEYDINLRLKGPMARLETTLEAPGSTLSESQVAMLLATGSLPAQGATIPAIGANQLLAYVSGEFLGAAGRAIGLDTVRLEQGSADVRFDAGLIAAEADPGSRLTFGKQVTRDVDLVFSKNLKDTGTFMWIVGYRPRANVEVRVVSQENTDRIYDLRHDLTIGGAPAPAASPPAPRPRIAAVRFISLSGISARELHNRLKLTEGKRFDFYTWQQDRERIEALCRERGRLEGRVAARRSNVATAGEPGVDLEYDVRCGPTTTIDITGAPHEATLRRAIEAAWSHSVFDTFLIDEVRTMARAALIRDGYLRATVGVSMDSPDGEDRKRLVVAIGRGPRSDRRRLRFGGNQQIGTDRLQALAVARGLNETAWLDPAALARAVSALYRDEGFLAARVVVGEPVFDGAAATLPVTIDEGPPFRIARIDFTGARSQSADQVRQVFGLEPGSVLTRTDMDRAAAALEDHYRAQGFGQVRVALTSRADAASGLVSLTVTIDEGPRQVLRDVTIEGTRRTSQAFVSRELRFGVGQPVNLSDWSAARKRLSDSGAFRRVDIVAVPMPAEPPSDQPAPEQPVRARVRLEEWPPLRLRYGFELADQQKPAAEGRTLRPGVAADATFRNFFASPVSVVLAGRYTKDFRAARGLLTAPSFIGLPLTSNLFVVRSREQVGSGDRPFVSDKTGFTAEQRFWLGDRLQIAYSYNFERNHTFDVNAKPDDPFAFDVTVNVARLAATGIHDTRDDLVDATRGQFFSATFEYGASALGSDLRFSKLFVEQSYYRTLGRGLVFATNGRLGVGAGHGQELIPSERFFAGGGNSVRGYGEGTLGPRDFFGDPAGGNAMLVLNEELRFPIVWRLRGVAFFDAGNAFATIGDLAPGELRSSAGAGLRIQAPFALFRLDLGAPLGRRAGEPRAAWFFSIGQIF